MSEIGPRLEEQAVRGLGELLQDRLGLPTAPALAIAHAILQVASAGPWHAWPETARIEGEDIPLPRELQPIISGVREELRGLVQLGANASADQDAVRLILQRLDMFPAEGTNGRMDRL